MGNERSAARGGDPTGRWAPVSRWKSILSKAGGCLSSGYAWGAFQTARRNVREQRRLSGDRAECSDSGNTGWPFPRFISLFFPVFPYRSQRVDQEFQDVEFIAKGSFGPILKVCQRTNEQTYAVKVLLKTEIVRQGVLQQCKDGVDIQKQVRHPFVQGLQECWQTSRLLFIMCDYHCAGDLFMLWTTCRPMGEGRVRVFAAELGSAIGFLHDFGVVHRDVKMENVLLSERGHLKLTDFGLSRRLCRGERANTICGTVQYMAPEVLRGSPYNHAADWWSLGVLLYTLVAGKFPVDPQRDHAAMLVSVQRADIVPPASISQSLAFLLAELLCSDPQLRLHRLDAFREHRFFLGLSFDPDLLQKLPLEFHRSAENQPPPRPDPSPFTGFDCELLAASGLGVPG
uniref:ribosomal protein S6 kinase-related protein n=1 Tax=Pristiophorus japonicus TaxID=55135 RepID=UPI00398EE78C